MWGRDSWVDVEMFGKAKKDWLSRLLELPQRYSVSRHLRSDLREVRQKWLRKSEQGDKWNRCLIEGMIVLSETGARDEQTTPP